ncbi:MAG: hypothetical protein HFE88_10345 [Acutalibacter sp.]|nr:hypothetical protein [Acutalibacter sp.]
MSTLKDTTFFKKLKSQESEKSLIYSGVLLQLSDDIGKFLQLIKKNFPDFPDHGEQHSYRILDYIARILGHQIDRLSDTEIFCFILAVLFHDTGMSLVGFSTKNVLRVKHPENASVVIDVYFEEALTKFKNIERIKPIVKYVCKAHGMDIDVMYKDPEFSEIDTINGDNVRNSVLSVLLRMGDLLDLDLERVDWVALKLFPVLFSEEAKSHNIRHLNVQRYQYDSETLKVQVQVQNIAEYKIWSEWFGYLDKEILYANTRLKKENISFPALSKSIKKADGADIDIEDIRFELDDKGSLWEIISKSIYTNEFDFVREVIQNAIDATLIDTYHNHTIPIKHPSPRSWTLSKHATPIFVCYSASTQLLYIIDHGIGMNDSDLRRFLFKVSSTGYHDINDRAFPFPSIAKYGIGFVSCLINAEKIEIYTAKENDRHMQKVTLETGLNQALIERMLFDDYFGTTLVIKLKHQYSFQAIYDYICETFRYPSVEISCIDIDILSANTSILKMNETFNSCLIHPYKLISSIDNIMRIKNDITKPIQNKLSNLGMVENGVEELTDWIRENCLNDEKYNDKEKFLDFKISVKELLDKIQDTDLIEKFPFSLSKVQEKDLLNTPDEYLKQIDKFIKFLRKCSGHQSRLLKKYPPFYYTIPKQDISINNNWDFIVADLDDNLEIGNIKQYQAPIDLSQRTGIILLKHTFKNYDEGIEYAAINGFLFTKGSITVHLLQLDGYSKKFGSIRKEKKNIIIGFNDYYSDISEVLTEEYLDSLEKSDNETFGDSLYDGESILGMEFAPIYNGVFIEKNEFIYQKDVEMDCNNDFANLSNKISGISSLLRFDSKKFPEMWNNIHEIDSIESIKSVYCQDGIAIPFEIEQLFPIGYLKLICNTTHSARMALNVTRHETSRIKSDVAFWYDNVGNKIQKQIYQHVSRTLHKVKLDFNFSELLEAYWSQNKGNVFGIKSKKNLMEMGKGDK